MSESSSVCRGVVLAAGLSACLVALSAISRGDVGFHSAAAIVFGGLIIDVLARTSGRGGTLTLGLAAALVLSSALLLGSARFGIVSGTAVLWALRTVLRHESAIIAAADLALSLASLAAGWWALTHSGSVVWAAWTLLLVQALAALLPRALPAGRGDRVASAHDPFDDAHRVAELALRDLAHR